MRRRTGGVDVLPKVKNEVHLESANRRSLDSAAHAAPLVMAIQVLSSSPSIENRAMQRQSFIACSTDPDGSVSVSHLIVAFSLTSEP